MKVTIITPAWSIPAGMTVRKATGKKEFTLIQEVKLYGLTDKAKFVTESENIRFLQCDEYITIISDDTPLAIDFGSAREAQSYLETRSS